MEFLSGAGAILSAAFDLVDREREEGRNEKQKAGKADRVFPGRKEDYLAA